MKTKEDWLLQAEIYDFYSSWPCVKVSTYGVLRSLYSLATVSIPPPRAIATKHD